MAAIMKGPTSAPTSSSKAVSLPDGWAGPVKPGVRAKGLIISWNRAGLRRMASMVAAPLAAVPPDRPPRMFRTRPFTRGTGWPRRRLAVSSANRTPSSKGMESKPQEKRMRAPEALAASWWAATISAIQLDSPHRST